MQIRSINNQPWMGNVRDVDQNDCVASPLNIRRSHVTMTEITTKSGSPQQNSWDIYNKHVDTMVFMWDGDNSKYGDYQTFIVQDMVMLNLSLKHRKKCIVSLWICVNTKHHPLLDSVDEARWVIHLGRCWCPQLCLLVYAHTVAYFDIYRKSNRWPRGISINLAVINRLHRL